jgi:predicted ATPase/class 3 adenylate cyclase
MEVMKHFASEPPSGTVTFASLDIVSTYPVSRGFESWLTLCSDLAAEVSSILEPLGGYLVAERSTTKELLYAFARPSKAIEGLAHIQRQTLTSPLNDQTGLKLRAGVYTGEVDSVNGTYIGFALEQAISLKDLAYGGQLLVSLSTQELVRTLDEQGFEFRDLGTHRVQELGRAERVFQIEAAGLASEFPPIRSLESALTNVETHFNGFVGRQREMYEIGMQLRAARILTLTGCGGIGKSRTAHQLARSVLHDYRDGVYSVDFGNLENQEFIPETIASELPFLEIGGQDLPKRLTEQLKDKQLLLVFDNCDGIGAPLARFIEDVFLEARGVEIIVTARNAIGMRTELCYPLQPLELVPLAGTGEEVSASFNLLLQRVRDSLPGFVLQKQNYASFNEICVALRGLPLALEVTAMKFKGLPLEEIRNEILQFTEGSLSSRQSDLQAIMDLTLEWAYDALPLTERCAFRRLAVFVSGWEEDMPSEVAVDGSLTADEIQRAITALTQKNVVVVKRRGPSVTRLFLPRSLWQFAAKKLAESGEAPVMKARHLAWFTPFAGQAEGEIRGPNQHRMMERLDREKQNLRAAIEFALSSEVKSDQIFGLVNPIAMFWYKRGRLTEGRIWLERILSYAGPEETERRCRALNILGVFLTADGQLEKALEYLTEATAVAKSLGNASLAAVILGNMGIAYRGLRQMEASQEAFLGAANTFRDLGEKGKLATYLGNLGAIYSESGQYDKAAVALSESLELCEAMGDHWAVLHTMSNFAEVARRQNSLEKAEQLFAKSLTGMFEQKDFRTVAGVLKSMAFLAEQLDQEERAATILGASAAIRDRIHQELPEIELDEHKILIDKLIGSLGEVQFYKKWNEGSNLSAEAAVQFALGGKSHSIA